MHESDNTTTLRRREPKEIFDPRRRSLLLWIPSALFAGIAATLATAAYRFLRPRKDEDVGSPQTAGGWVAVAPLSTLSGDQPVLQTLLLERRAGWSLAREERAIYVLPGTERRVVSAICPHEQCDVAWSAQTREFLCPCHDSRFGPEGSRLTGPAVRDLDALPTRVENGVLQVRLSD